MFSLVENNKISSGPITIRWLRIEEDDFKNVARLIAIHPDFKNKKNIVQDMCRILSDRKSLAIVAVVPNPKYQTTNEEQKDLVVGFMNYYLYSDRLEVPLFVAISAEAADALMEKLMAKFAAFARLNRVFVRTNYDMNVLNSLKKFNFGTRANGDYIVAEYPKSNKATPELFTKYDQVVNPLDS